MPLLSAAMKGIVSRVCAVALLLCGGDVGVAHADIGPTLGGRFASDQAVKDHVLSLIDKDVHFTLSLGLWMAFLSQGPIGSATTTNEYDGPESADQASSRVGTGRGLLRDATLSLDYKGNELYFRYLSDQLLQVGEDELSKRVPNNTAQSLIRQIAGELRPDLSKLLGPQAKAYGRVTYGDFRGGISDAYIFASRNGVPYFAGRDASWRTRYVSVEAGVAPGGKLSYFARYTSFQRPVVLEIPLSGALYNEGGSYKKYGGFALQDGTVSVYGVGPRYQTQSCGSSVCFQLDGGMIPLLGYATLDLGRTGKVSGLPFVGSAEARLLMPFKVGPVPLAPFVSFRAEWFLLFVSSAKAISGDELASLNKPNLFAPDYLLWGPLLGISGEL